MVASLTPENFINPYTYEEYKTLIYTLAKSSSNTGDKSEERVSATKINAQRIKRIDKQCELTENLINSIQNFKTDCFWILITESWCGDGAQCIPVISKIVEQSQNIELKLLLRDENLDIIDLYLTNGSRSVPKLICIDKNSNEDIGVWGPRPNEIQKMVLDYKTNNPNSTHDEFVNNLHLWYARDKTQSIQDEFIDLLNAWNSKL
jgi:hypothetical protein